jgi:hypothetical protein
MMIRDNKKPDGLSKMLLTNKDSKAAPSVNGQFVRDAISAHTIANARFQ